MPFCFAKVTDPHLYGAPGSGLCPDPAKDEVFLRFPDEVAGHGMDVIFNHSCPRCFDRTGARLESRVRSGRSNHRGGVLPYPCSYAFSFTKNRKYPVCAYVYELSWTAVVFNTGDLLRGSAGGEYAKR